MATRALGGLVFFVCIAALVAGAGRAAAQDDATHGAHLSVTMFRGGVDARPLVAPGQTVTLSIGVSNLRGDQAAHNAVLRVLLPPGLTLKEARPAPDLTEAPGDRFSWKLGTVDAGAFPRLFNLDLQTTTDATVGSRLGVAALVSASDQQPGDEDTDARIAFLVVNAAANLVLESNLIAVPFTTDEPVGFTVTVTNLGTAAASACVLKMIVPAKATFTGSDPAPSDKGGSVVTWPIGDIAPNESRSVAVKVALDPILRAAAYGFAPKLGSLTFKFDATTATSVFDPSTGHLEIERYPEPAGSKVAVSLNVPGVEHPGELPVGKDATFQVIYGNYGNAPASKVTVSLNLPKGLDLVGATPPPVRSNQGDASGSSVYSWDLGDLPVGESGIIASQIHVTSIGDDGSLVSAVISAEGDDVASAEKIAYSLQRAANSDGSAVGAVPRQPGSRQAEPRGGRARWWIVPIAVLALAALWAVRRARSKRAT